MCPPGIPSCTCWIPQTRQRFVRPKRSPERTLYAARQQSPVRQSSRIRLRRKLRRRLESAGLQWANHFVAITDEGTELARRARTERFRELFINPGDIGGRYSAISYFGLVPRQP